MRSFTITNADNTKMQVDLIRYFKFKTDCFLIYSIGEIDDKNYKKLYLVRIMEELGFPVVQTIKNEADWANMQGIVKKVLKELKKNSKKLTEDLDYREIEGIKIVEPRFFKLDAKLVDILASNYMEGELTNMNQELVNTFDTPVSNESVEGNQIQNVENIAPVAPLPIYSNDMDQLMPNVEATDVQINNSVDASSNMTDVSNEVPLESIDQTMMNQGEFTPIEINDNNNVTPEVNLEEQQNVVSNVIQPIDSTIESNEPNVEPIVNEPVDVQKVETMGPTPIVEKPIEPIMPQVDVAPINNIQTAETTPADTSTTSEVEPNYKELYEAIKADNDATNNLLSDVLNELNMYKEKYGELN